MHYNTTNENGSQLKKFKKQAEKQNQKVLRLCIKKQTFTCSEIFKEFSNTTKSSIHRALNTLENKLIISKSKTKVTGMFGKPETVYICLT